MRARCDRGGHSEWGAQQKSARAALLLGTLGLSASPAFADYFRDSIGPDSSATDNTGGSTNMHIPGVFADVWTFEVPPGNPGEIVSLDVVAGEVFGSCGSAVQCYGDMRFQLIGWNNRAEIVGSPLVGTLFNIDVSASLSLTPLFGISDDGGASSVTFPTSLLEVDLPGAGAVCPASGCVFALLVNVGSTPDVFEIRRSSLGGFEDWYYSLGIPPFNTHQTNGVRFRVVGPSPPPACSNSLDDDGDGKIDSADFGCTSVSDT